MPNYEFEKPDGTRVEKYFSYGFAPGLGATVYIDGQPCVRVVSLPEINADPVTKRYPRESRSAAQWPGCAVSKNGNPVFQNKAEEDRVVKTMGWKKEGINL